MSVVNFVLEEGADINNPKAKLVGVTALRAAVQKRSTELVQQLLDLGADPNDPEALLEAVIINDIHAAKLLLQWAWRMPHRPAKNYGCPALQKAIVDEKRNMIEVLLAIGISPNVWYARSMAWQQDLTEGVSALGAAIMKLDKWKGNLWLVRALLTAGADPNALVYLQPQTTALVAAIETQSVPLVQLLLDSGADVNHGQRTYFRRTPLQAAAETGNHQLVRMLLAVGADVDAPPYSFGGVTALQAAAISGSISVANTLLNHGADPNAPAARGNGRTALEAAAEHGRLDMIQLLLEVCTNILGSGEKHYKRAVKLATAKRHYAAASLLTSNMEQQRRYQAESVTIDVDMDFENFFANLC